MIISEGDTPATIDRSSIPSRFSTTYEARDGDGPEENDGEHEPRADVLHDEGRAYVVLTANGEFHIGSTFVRIEPKFSSFLVCAESIQKDPHRQPESGRH